MTARLCAGLLAAFLATSLSVSASAAQEALATPAVKAPKATAKRATTAAVAKERRPGELEGWDSGVKSPVVARKALPPGTISEKQLPDGGLPLPEARETGKAPPVGVNADGKVGGMFRF